MDQRQSNSPRPWILPRVLMTYPASGGSSECRRCSSWLETGESKNQSKRLGRNIANHGDQRSAYKREDGKKYGSVGWLLTGDSSSSRPPYDKADTICRAFTGSASGAWNCINFACFEVVSLSNCDYKPLHLQIYSRGSKPQQLWILQVYLDFLVDVYLISHVSFK
jgi:hypothetical protein